MKDELCVCEGVILRGNRILFPFLLRTKLLKLSHEMHQGIVKTKQFLKPLNKYTPRFNLQRYPVVLGLKAQET